VGIDSGDSTVRVVGTVVGRRHRPHLLEVWGQRFDLQLENQITLFRYRDVPGMIGRVGTCFGEHGINIVSAAAGRDTEDRGSDEAGLQVMIVVTDGPVPREVIDQIVATDGFHAGRTVTL
jgi:D-3-phosphoglycerate dehydrogenase